MNKNNLSENLYELRKRSGISQEEFAEKLGVSRRAVSKWERGEAYPDTENLIAISELFDVTIDDLLRSCDIGKNEKINPQQSDCKIEATVYTVNDDDDDDTDDNDDENHIDNSKRGFISIFYALPYPIVTTVAFLAIGLFANGWYWAWTLFITIPVYYSLLDCIRKRRTTEFAYPVLTAFLYCLFGMLFAWWHPGWIIFVTIPIYYPIAEAIDRYIRRKRK